ncbi:uncharacterized protein cubi_03291 [Cryptosporidium ubiquitum]|uniref:Uncharacterized protein n=1 Tax=Cryptosporidium ubiquitum TaxID=857276 RepID=A0A1J4M9U7_9CRYT|nr:uncharacterized protein cubi_03291 [Cryptosporidium ubiquitum]OII70993.1 hypothetical protein cubi_03291 [Cryptosporidium ubiquitum]
MLKDVESKKTIQDINFLNFLELIFHGIIKYCHRFGILNLYKSLENKQEPRFETIEWSSYPQLMDFIFPQFPLEDGMLTDYQLFGFDFLLKSGSYSDIFKRKIGDLILMNQIGPGFGVGSGSGSGSGEIPGAGVGLGFGESEQISGAGGGTEQISGAGDETEQISGVGDGAVSDTKDESESSLDQPLIMEKLPIQIENEEDDDFPLTVEIPGITPEQEIVDNLDLYSLSEHDFSSNVIAFSEELTSLLLPKHVEAAMKYLQGCNIKMLFIINSRIETVKELLNRLNLMNIGINGIERELLMKDAISNVLLGLLKKLQSYLEKCRSLNKYKVAWIHIAELKGKKNLILNSLHPSFINSSVFPFYCDHINLRDISEFMKNSRLKLKNLRQRLNKMINYKEKSSLKKEISILKVSIRRNKTLLEICEKFIDLKHKNNGLYNKVLNVLNNFESNMKLTKNDIYKFHNKIGSQLVKGTIDEEEDLNGLYRIYLSLVEDLNRLNIDEIKFLAKEEGLSTVNYLEKMIDNLKKEQKKGFRKERKEEYIPLKPIKTEGKNMYLMNILTSDPEILDSYSLYCSFVKQPLNLDELIVISDYDKTKLMILLAQLSQNSSKDNRSNIIEGATGYDPVFELGGYYPGLIEDEIPNIEYEYLLRDKEVTKKYLNYISLASDHNSPLELMDFIKIPGNREKDNLMKTLDIAINLAIKEKDSDKLQKQKKPIERSPVSPPKQSTRKSPMKQPLSPNWPILFPLTPQTSTGGKITDLVVRPKEPKGLPLLPSIPTGQISKPKLVTQNQVNIAENLKSDFEIFNKYLDYSSVTRSPLGLEDLIIFSNNHRNELIKILDKAISEGNKSTENSEYSRSSPRTPFTPGIPVPVPLPAPAPAPASVPVPWKPLKPSAAPSIGTKTQLRFSGGRLDQSSVDQSKVSLATLEKHAALVQSGYKADSLSKLQFLLKVSKTDLNHLKALERFVKGPIARCSTNRSSCNNCFVCNSRKSIDKDINNMEKVITALQALIEYCIKNMK